VPLAVGSVTGQISSFCCDKCCAFCSCAPALVLPCSDSIISAVVRAQCLHRKQKCGLSSKSLACVIYFLSSSHWFHRPCATRLFSSSSVVAPACVQSLPLTIFILIFVRSRVRVYELLQELVSVFVLSHRIKSLEDLWSKSFSCGSFPNTPIKCSVKYLRGDKLFFESIYQG
jgi:hypothetical protein